MKYCSLNTTGLVFASLLSASAGQDAIAYAKTQTNLIQLGDSYVSGKIGEAVLTMLPGESDVQKSNYGWRSCQIENTGDKRIVAVYIDVSTALFRDMVFDSDGSGGDNVAKPLSHDWGTTETNPIAINQYQWQWKPARSGANYNPTASFVPGDLRNVNNLFVNELSDSGLGASGGYRGALMLFKDFDHGETYEFSADMDPNSIAGLQQGTASIDAEWDVGGVSGAELIGSVVTILFGDGTTATGTIASDGSQAGGVAVISSRLVASPALKVAGLYGPGQAGIYSSAPSVVLTATPGSKVRVTMIQAFDPVDNQSLLAGGKITAESLVTARLVAQYPNFPVNNAHLLQRAEVVVPSSGSVDVTASFPVVGQDALAYTAVAIDSLGFPVSFTMDPIYLLYNKNSTSTSTSCPSGQKRDGSGDCVLSSCNSNFQCPANSTRKLNRLCYKTFDDCNCNSGFTRTKDKCVAAKAEKKKKSD